MDYQPDWKSKILVALFGKRRLMTLLDTNQLMYKQDFQRTKTYQSISNKILYSAVGTNIFILLTSFALSRKFFTHSKVFSFPKLITDSILIFSSYYAAAIYLSTQIKQPVHSAKGEYLRHYDPDFIFHFNYLAAKYQIQEQLQTEGIYNRQQLSQWIDSSRQRITQVKEV